MIDSTEINQTARYLLSFGPDPAPRVHLLRDILRVPQEEEGLRQARRELEQSQWVVDLECEQWPDGSWGRLHSQDTHTNQKILTTEYGVRRGLALGLTADSPILCRAADYLESVLATGDCLDPEEKNDRWPVGVQLFTASTLALIQPERPSLDAVYELWLEIARRAFHSGQYDKQAEIDIHRALTGANIQDSYLHLNNQYALNLISSRPGRLPAELAEALLHWIWQRAEGIGYKNVALWPPPNPQRAGLFDRWLDSLSILSRFPGWRTVAQPALQWLTSQRGTDGLWDLGKRDPASAWLPLSESWRKAGQRKVDWTTRILCLLIRP